MYSPPPTVSPILPSPFRGVEAKEYLEGIGLVAQVPAVRSSDVRYLSCPFLYYLMRRLNITPIFKLSDAFSHGDWVHVRPTCKEGDDPAEFMRDKFKEWVARVTLAAGEVGMGESAIATYVTNELTRMREAMVWWDAWMAVRCKGLVQGFPALYDPEEWQVLGREVILAMPSTNPATKVVVQLDALLLHKPTYSIWIDDYKTEAGSPNDRAKICTNEHQTRTYILTTHHCLGKIGVHYNLDLDRLSFGGMRHIILHKPGIRFGMNDRDYRWTAESKKSKLSGFAVKEANDTWSTEITETMECASGLNEESAIQWLHNRVKKKPEKQFQLEPNLDNYRRRVINYLNAKGEYTHKSVDYAVDPPILVSRTQGFLDRDAERECRSILRTITNMAVLPGACPNDYPRTAEGMVTGHGSKKPSPYAEFFEMPVMEWPNIMRRNLLIVNPRDKADWLEMSDSEFLE